MTKSDSNPEQLIQKIINFLDKERELYGDFHIPGNSIPKEDPNFQEKDEAQVSELNSDPEKQDLRPSTFDPKSEWFKSIENQQLYYQIDQCKTLDELEVLCGRADILRTDLADTKLVFGTGNPNADLILIGEAPGAEEDRRGEPFVGKAGQLLNKILKAVDFEREDVYISNILKHRPPNNRNPKEIERKRSLPFLLRQIDLINPKFILSLGKISAQTLLNKSSSLSNMRGSFHPFRKKYQLLATYHPAALLRHSQWKRPTWEDVQMLRKQYDEAGGQP